MFKRHKHQHISLQSRVVGVWEQRKKKIFKRTCCYCGSCLKNLEMQMMIVMQKDMCVCVCLYPKIKRLLYTHGYTIYICFCTVLSTISHVLVLIASPCTCRSYFITNASSSICLLVQRSYNNRRKSGICVETTFGFSSIT